MRKMQCTCSSRTQTGCGRMTGLRPLPRRGMFTSLLFFSLRRRETRNSLARAWTRVGITQRVSALAAMKFAFGRLASHSRLNFLSSVSSLYSEYAPPIILLRSCVASNIHVIFIVKHRIRIYMHELSSTISPCLSPSRRGKKEGGKFGAREEVPSQSCCKNHLNIWWGAWMRASSRFRSSIYAKNTDISRRGVARGKRGMKNRAYAVRTDSVSVALKRERVPSPTPLRINYFIWTGTADENCSTARRTHHVRIINSVPKYSARGASVVLVKFEGRVGEVAANMTGCDSPGGFSAGVLSFSLESPRCPRRCVFVTTKLREKFVARIPAAGARSHAKGKKREMGGGRKEREKESDKDAMKTSHGLNTNVSSWSRSPKLWTYRCIIARVIT